MSSGTSCHQAGRSESSQSTAMHYTSPALRSNRPAGLLAVLRRCRLRSPIVAPAGAATWPSGNSPPTTVNGKVALLGFGPRLEVRQKIRPPLSPHRHGLPVALLRPSDPAEALAALTPRRPKVLKPEWREFIKVGAPEGQRSGKIQGLALAAVNAGWGYGDFYAVMTDPENRCGEKLRGHRDVLRYLERVWDNAMAFSIRRPAVKDREEALALVAKLRARADAWHWSGRDRDRRWGPTGQTDRQVLEGHFIIVERTGKIVHAASVRELAELTGLHADTVADAHRRLRHEGWLRLHQGASRWTTDAAVWRLTGPTATTVTADVLWRQSVPGGLVPLPSSDIHDQGASERVSGEGNMAHDVWSRKGLGQRAGSVYAMLDPTIPKTTASIAAHIGVGRAAVWKHLARLRAHGLATNDNKRGWLRGGADLDAVATKLGVAGHSEAKRQEHKRQRQRYTDFLEGGGHRSQKKEQHP